MIPLLDTLARARLSPQTLRLYRDAIRRYLAYCQRIRQSPMINLTAIKYITSRLASGLSRATVDVDISALTYAFSKNRRTFPIVCSVGPRKRATPAQIERLLATCSGIKLEDQRDRFILTQLVAGRTVSELALMRVKDAPSSPWIDVLRVQSETGAALRGIRVYDKIERGTVIGAPLGANAINRIVRERGRAAGIPNLTSRMLDQR